MQNSWSRKSADLGTKVLDVNTHRHLCSIIGLGPANQAVEEIKGHKRNLQSCASVRLLNVWKGVLCWRFRHKRIRHP